MTPHEIRPSQLRALLLLLVIIPLMPTGLMLQFMFDTVRTERTVALERLSAIYQQTLANADATFARHIAGRHDVTPRETHNYYRALLDRDVVVRVIDSNGVPLTGNTVVTNAPVGQTSLHELGLPWSVQVFLLDVEKLDIDQQQQFHSYLWIVGVVLVGIVAFALLAVSIVSRQIELRDLRSTAVATVAHELRTPLASMRMLVDTLREGRYRGETQLTEYLALIAQENERLARLANDFLTFTQLERGTQRLDIQPIAPCAVVEQALAALRPRLEAAAFTLNVPESLPAILADRDALVIVLSNLLDNALKYSDGEPCIALEARDTGQAVAFVVEDHGIGIPASERARIFRPFHQGDMKLSRRREGVGLGLSIVEQLVHAHRGTIAVASEPGRGSTFTIAIPKAPASSFSSSSSAASPAEGKR
jgi:signal transduction histidine kinase